MEINEIVDTRIKTPEEKLALAFSIMAETLKPKEIIPFDVWMDSNIKIPLESSSVPGDWDTSLFPFWRQIMQQVFTPRAGKCREFVMRKGCQIAFTTVSISHTMYIADQYPSPSQFFQPSKDAAITFMTTKWEPFVRNNPISDTTLGKKAPQGYTNKTLEKTYPGGFFIAGGINNVDFLKSKSVRYQYYDEEDSYEISSKEDGSNIEVGKKRTNSFPDKLIVRGTTPKYEETSTNHKAFMQGCQAEYYLPCPFCNPDATITGTRFALRHEMFTFRGEVIDDLVDEVFIECPNCGEEIHESAKPWMMDEKNAMWMSVRHSEDGKPQYCDFREMELVSVHLPSYYAPLGFLSWREAFKDFFKYQRTKDTNDLQVYKNQIEGLPISKTGDSDVDRTGLEKRADVNPYGSGAIQCPAGVLMLTAAFDIQGDRGEGIVLGHGLDGEVWVIDYVVFPGDTSVIGNADGLGPNNRPTAWFKMADFLMRKKYRHESGCHLPIEATFIDAGYRTDVVHNFCLRYEAQGVYPVIGRPGWNDGKIKIPQARHKKYKTKLYTAMKDPLIQDLYDRLMVAEEGPRFVHFPKHPRINSIFFRSLTSERRVVRKLQGGKEVIGWEKTFDRNEAGDTWCYAVAAFLASGESLGIRAGRKYPLPDRHLTFWQEKPEPELRRKMSSSIVPKTESQDFMKPKRRRVPQGHTVKKLGKGVERTV